MTSDSSDYSAIGASARSSDDGDSSYQYDDDDDEHDHDLSKRRNKKQPLSSTPRSSTPRSSTPRRIPQSPPQAQKQIQKQQIQRSNDPTPTPVPVNEKKKNKKNDIDFDIVVDESVVLPKQQQAYLPNTSPAASSFSSMNRDRRLQKLKSSVTGNRPDSKISKKKKESISSTPSAPHTLLPIPKTLIKAEKIHDDEGKEIEEIHEEEIPMDEDEAEEKIEEEEEEEVFDILFPHTMPECSMLMQLHPEDAADWELDGATGAVGRLEVDEKRRGVMLDLQGRQYRGTFLPCATALVVTVVTTTPKKSNSSRSHSATTATATTATTAARRRIMKVDAITDEFCRLVPTGQSALDQMSAYVGGDVASYQLHDEEQHEPEYGRNYHCEKSPHGTELATSAFSADAEFIGNETSTSSPKKRKAASGKSKGGTPLSTAKKRASSSSSKRK